ncbi:MAG: 50S ribosomal protein L5 [Candidatus Chisholmbacteria bacterium RIFCSPHIGHO2_01_FULL_49_18]|jgi:large subunit ribosomal protein L5|uniref:Large ribosomal subunit protein uL5 n=2 Tax=Candidatus Chisholmiibacteriota TaxID=1817900 RepID=A0A1G1VLU2_9BACT|nr:MAG: 50S ribosomal protein L5 [Candidatus Chisholmbacteria bacterium RIFCSPHIGHO2_01_FULL_49_18]OGY19383.1 MAG: 50S ribosomal protein L5 [Candidatus Chisholmbacteria bacterium RIFCSPLOWO2_01_FULL_49_14]
MNTIQKKYNEEVREVLKKELKLTNDLAVPKLVKIILNTSISQEQGRQEALQNMADQMAAVTGQRPVITQAKKSIAAFKLRAGDPIGVMVTLRSGKMYDFYERLVSLTLPRVKDFQGTKRNAFDGRGNYSLGLTEQLIFPEVNYDKIDKVRGLQVTFVTTAGEDKKALRLLELLGMPFEKEQEQNG